MKIFFGLPLRLFFHIQCEGRKDFPSPGQSAFVIGNHSNILDPVIVSSFVPKPICWVVGDNLFGAKVTRMFLRWIKIIPKTKNMPDSETMRMLLEAARQGQIIGLAPEGGRNWDGETLNLDRTLPRLIKKLKLPVICIRVKGAYLSWPRWASTPRRGRIMLSFSYLYENQKDIPDDEDLITQAIKKRLFYSELEDPEVTRHNYGNRRIAENLELRLWFCPHCMNFFSLKSKGYHLSCKRCGATWQIKGNGLIILEERGALWDSRSQNFTRYIDWAHYNDRQTIPTLEKLKTSNKDPLISIPAKMWSVPYSSERGRYYSYVGKGSARLTRDFRFVFTRSHDRKRLLDIHLSEMKGTNIAWNHRLEFFSNGNAYRFTFYGQSAYFWHYLTSKLPIH
ncbi:1-acyl-sn-glycerol-3-phosphate acyltransferase [candidate division WOR-3 bacterium]|nr:1-acyl-sn-glycerol-3-phosphate acyltransferase [candidate division WOR-3 bacterium]